MQTINPILLIHNIGFGSGSIIALTLALYVYFKDRHAAKNVTFALGFISVAIFCASHVIGVNVSDPILSRDILMWNISVIYIACFIAHCSFIIAGTSKQHRPFIIGSYVIAVVLTIIYVSHPDTYLLPSRPKLYFPNYYVAGSLQWIMRILYDVISPAYFLSYLVYAYHKADYALRNRLKYFFLSICIGYVTGSLAIPLVYDIPIDPVYASFFVPLLAIPMAYAIVTHNLMDIRVVAKRAFYYAVLVACTAILIIGVTSSNDFLANRYSFFPIWLIPLIASILAVGIGLIVWNRLRETDQLKYEFMTIITHKFRTPLTRVKWSLEHLNEAPLSDEFKEDLSTITLSNNDLVELTGELVALSENDAGTENYVMKSVPLNSFMKTLLDSYRHIFERKNIVLSFSPVEPEANAMIDPGKFSFAIQSILDNALTYTSEHGKVEVSVSDQSEKKERLLISIKDSGIGLDKQEMARIFEKFYRAPGAVRADTEGVGIGLYMTKTVVERLGGSIWVNSAGHGTGTTFYISIPRAR